MQYNLIAWRALQSSLIEQLLKHKEIDTLFPYIVDICSHHERVMMYANEVTENYKVALDMIEGYNSAINKTHLN